MSHPTTTHTTEKVAAVDAAEITAALHDSIDHSAQHGVRNIEGITTVWSRTSILLAFGLIWVFYFVQGMLNGTNLALGPFVTSAFAEHSLTPTVYILSAIIGGVSNLTIAKVLDVFGRPTGLLVCVIVAVVGLVIMAATTGVEMYAAAQVFYAVGNNGIGYTLSVLIADTTTLHNRGLIQAIVTSSNLITCWLAGPIATGFLDGPGWPWAYGMFSILVPVVTLPLYGLLAYNARVAEKNSILQHTATKRSIKDTALHYLQDFDAMGLLLLSAGVALFLLPFNLYTVEAYGWSSPMIICFLVFGIILLVAFVLWEKFVATTTFIPYKQLKNRTILGACLLSAVFFFSYYCWQAYFGSYLLVVNNLSITNASYVQQIITVGNVLCAIGVGVLIHYSGRYKAITLYLGIPLQVLGVGLMICFSNPDDIRYLIMCQIFIAVGGGIIEICDEIAVLATISHQHIAVTIAALGLFDSIGGAIGSTVATAIWTSVFPAKLAEYLPADDLDNLLLIYSDITTQLSYDVGTPTREAIQHAYADAQSNMLIAGTAVWALGFVAVLMWRDVKVTEIKQTRGHVV